MSSNHTAHLAAIRTFPALIKYLRDEMGWPIGPDSFEDLTFDFEPEELGIDAKNAAKISEIKRLRPLSSGQPFGIFFVKFEPKRLPVVALRRILSQVVLKKRATAKAAEHAAWAADDLLFVSNYGEGDARHISFAHFSTAEDGTDLPTLKVLGWDNLDTPLHLGAVAERLKQHLSWPNDEEDAKAWRQAWRGAFDLRHREVINTSQTLSVRLAELASAIRNRIRTALAIETEKGPLTRLMKAFQDALVHDLDADEFADMYAQTIAYGLLSSRIANPKARTADDFAAHMRTNPLLRELMQTFLQAGGRRGRAGGPEIDFDELGVSEVVDLLDRANMEAVLRDFGDRNPLEDPVIHFYELFLSEYDAEKRMQRGVFYTPRPVVSFIVRSVDELLRTEFGLADGLADTTTWGEMARRIAGLQIPNGVSEDEPFVQILDPATGTGTFLVEVIGQIEATMRGKWEASRKTEAQIAELWNEYVPKHLLPRLHAFELMMAPYAIAHLKVGLKLYETGYRFASEERARVFLTNALEPASDAGQQRLALILPALADEARSVNAIKRRCHFTVVVGNPPYAGHSQNNDVQSIVDQVYDYKRGYPDLQKPGQAKWLQDDYVKFLRYAEHHIERAAAGIVGFITNHAWLDNPTFKGMRQHFLRTFSQIAVLDLHGNANKKERAEDGSKDENVFNIKQGVAISILSRNWSRSPQSSAATRRGDLLGLEADKLQHLAQRTVGDLARESLKPLPPEMIFADRDPALKAEYDTFVSLPAIFSKNGDPAPGIVTTHDEFAISFTRQEQIEKVESLLSTRSESEARKLFTLCSQNQWSYRDAKRALAREDWRSQICNILYRPFDRRWTVYNRHVAVHRRERVMSHMRDLKNIGIISTRQTKDRWGAIVTEDICAHKTCGAYDINYLFPLWITPDLGGMETTRRPRKQSNLNGSAVGNLLEMASDLGAADPDMAVFAYVYAVLFSNGYRERYKDLLKTDFARIPADPPEKLFEKLRMAGEELIQLHLMRGARFDQIARCYTGPARPTVERVAWAQDAVWLDAPVTRRAQPNAAGRVGFRGVPEAVWSFHVGGYQVCEKWLKDRKGLTLSSADIAHYEKIIVAISETIRVMGAVDDTIEEFGGWPGAFKGAVAEVAA